MRRIVYLGSKPSKGDNVAKTGLTWSRGQIHDIADDSAADKLLEHPEVWADANKKYTLAEPIEARQEIAPEPRLQIVPQGGSEVPFWEPIVITVPGEMFKELQEKTVITVFMKPEEADSYAEYKAAKVEQKVDKRSKEYKEAQKAA